MLDKKPLKTSHKIENFSFKIKMIAHNPNMKDFDGRHYLITVTNADNKKESFLYTVGKGHKIEDRTGKKLVEGLLSCLYLDSIYTDFDEFDGLGYEGKEAIDTYNAICDNAKKVKNLGMEPLTEKYSDY